MKTKTITLKVMVGLGLILCLSVSSKLYAQVDTTVNSPKGGSQKMAFPGYATTLFQLNASKGNPTNHTFMPVGLAVFPLIKFNDRLFLDCAATLTANSDGSVTPGIGELVGYYRINPYVTAFFGNFSPHYGVYLGILDDFTNRFGTGVAPIGMGHALQNQTGVGIQGGIQAGYSKFTYQLYVANGPQLHTDSATVGQLGYDSYVDNNKNKSVGWHVGFLPFSNSCLEVTFSGRYAGKTGATGDPNENVSAVSTAYGLNYYHLFRPIMVRVIAEYDNVMVKNPGYVVATSDTSNKIYNFSNKQSGWFAGATLRYYSSRKAFIRNWEIAGRQGNYTPPADAPWGGKPTNQTTLTLTYWLTWAIPLSFEYDILTQSGSPTQKYFSTVLFFRF